MSPPTATIIVPTFARPSMLRRCLDGIARLEAATFSFEVVVVTPDLGADAIALRDADGQKVDVLRIDSESVNAWTSAPLVEGRSGVLSASSQAVVLDLLRGEETVKSVPLDLRAGEVTRIEM